MAFRSLPLQISGAAIPGAVLRLQDRNGNVKCDPEAVAVGTPVTRYTYEQPVASPVWVVNHNLGVLPDIRVYSPGNREMMAEIVHSSANLAYIYFDNPTAGRAVCS